jgi:hypothetical protein
VVGHIFGRLNFSPGRGKLRDSLRPYQLIVKGKMKKEINSLVHFKIFWSVGVGSMNSELSTGRGKMLPFGKPVGNSKFLYGIFIKPYGRFSFARVYKDFRPKGPLVSGWLLVNSTKISGLKALLSRKIVGLATKINCQTSYSFKS